jgi:hypothetical protein
VSTRSAPDAKLPELTHNLSERLWIPALGGRIRCGVTAWDAAFLRQDKLKHTVTKVKGAITV